MDFISIGGYFELETCNRGSFPYQKGILLNSGRNCFDYLIRANNIQQIYIPKYCCKSILEPIQKSGTDFSFYNINDKLEIEPELSLNSNSHLLYINYFGLKDGYVKKLFNQLGNKLIIDNSQAFFSEPLEDSNTIYSLRKFFGVPDGGVAFSRKKLDEPFEENLVHENCSHLLKRIDVSAEYGFSDFQKNEKYLAQQPIRKISKLSYKILNSLDYKIINNIRIQNFKFLDTHLAIHNNIHLKCSNNAPLIYPFLHSKGSDLKNHLLSKKIYCASYWPDVTEWTSNKELEYYFTKNLVALPVDQRYNKNHMEIIIDEVYGYFNQTSRS